MFILNSLKYLLMGALIWFFGLIFTGDSREFAGRSEPAMLAVVEMDFKRDRDGDVTYQPIFALANAETGHGGHAGKIWYSVPPHEVGDVVTGRHDAATGEMRSDKMLQKALWSGRICNILSALLAFQAVALLFGVPERLLPLKVRIGGRRRRLLRIS